MGRAATEGARLFKAKYWAVAVLAAAGVTWGAFTAPAMASQASIGVTTNTAGASGYYGADDGHTHYRFVQTHVQAEPTLNNLNGSNSSTNPGAVGVELCDPNSGFAAQTGLIDNNGTYEVLWAYGNLHTNLDPCVQSGLVQPTVSLANCPLGSSNTIGGVTCGAFNLGTIASGDHVYLGVYYSPGGKFFHRLSFGDCVQETGICRQSWSNLTTAQYFWEFGIGALTQSTTLTAPALNQLETFSSNDVTCYSCKSQVPIGEVQTVSGIGGLTEANFINSSSQVVMSPNGSLAPYPSKADTFTLSEGSTSA